MYRKYYSYSDMPQLVKKKETEICEHRESNEVCCPENPHSDGKLFGRFSTDDVLLAAIIITLLMDDNSDSMLIVALLAVFLSGLL